MQRNWGSSPWTIDFKPTGKELPPKVDLAVVGGGFTGLAAAAWFKTLAPAKSVAVFETETVGAGSSGHTGGMVLAETAVGDLPGLGDVLAGYREILAKLDVEGDLELPGVYELGRKQPLKQSPICWKDSGDLCVVEEVSGGSINPGKVVSGLAQSAQSRGVLVFEHAGIQEVRFDDEIQLHSAIGKTQAKNILFATNAFGLDLNGLQGRAAAAFTTAMLTEPLSAEAIAEAGLQDRKPFYTVDLPYLWGRFLGDSVIFGSGLVFVDDPSQLNSLNIEEGEALILYDKLKQRIGKLHPALREIAFTHRWGGPICIAEEWQPVFEYHPKSRNAIVLGAYSGHGVAQSVYLGSWAAEVFLGKRELPDWK